MPANCKAHAIGVTAIADDGRTYVIERRSRSLPGDRDQNLFFFYCLANGDPVGWLGYGTYQLSDGTVLRTPRVSGGT